MLIFIIFWFILFCEIAWRKAMLTTRPCGGEASTLSALAVAYGKSPSFCFAFGGRFFIEPVANPEH
jgi:hypothetical protein